MANAGYWDDDNYGTAFWHENAAQDLVNLYESAKARAGRSLGIYSEVSAMLDRLDRHEDCAGAWEALCNKLRRDY